MEKNLETNKVYNVTYKWGNGRKNGIGRYNPDTDNFSIITEDCGLGFETRENIEVINEIGLIN